MNKENQFKVYLGDSVYASFDGYHIWLTTENGYPDDPRNKIALEPNVFGALIGYQKALSEKLKESGSAQ